MCPSQYLSMLAVKILIRVFSLTEIFQIYIYFFSFFFGTLDVVIY